MSIMKWETPTGARIAGRPPVVSEPGAKTKPDLAKSAYYWWWRYLRANKEYLKCCEIKSSGWANSRNEPFISPSIRKLYLDFGDVRSDDFMKWWSERGESLFAEPQVPVMKVIEGDGDLAGLDPATYLKVLVPLGRDKRALVSSFTRLLKENHLGQVGGNRLARTTARYKLTGKPVVEALAMTLKVHEFRQDFPELALWQIGQAAKVSEPHLIKEGDLDFKDKRRRLTQLVDRYLRHAKAYIKNVAEGEFPKK
jgi:hypothetical protein